MRECVCAGYSPAPPVILSCSRTPITSNMMRKECVRVGIKKSGRKADVIQRLLIKYTDSIDI